MAGSKENVIKAWEGFAYLTNSAHIHTLIISIHVVPNFKPLSFLFSFFVHQRERQLNHCMDWLWMGEQLPKRNVINKPGKVIQNYLDFFQK